MTEHTPRDGLTGTDAVHNPVIHAVESPKRWTRGRIIIQCVGFLIGIGLFILTCMLAFSEENQQQLDALRTAPIQLMLLLMLFSASSIIANGVMFWITLLPHRRLNTVDVIATNAIATFLSLLPFKLGLLIRALIHHRRDGVSFKMLLAWFASMSALALAIVIPMALAGLWRGEVDALWWTAAIAGPIACTAAGVICGRLATRFPILSTLSLGADKIVRDIPTVTGHFIVRIVDVALLAGRFMVAAKILGLEMTLDQAILIGTTYFLLSVLSPTGTLGTREAGTAGVGMLQGIDVAAVALLVTAAETLAALLLSLPGAYRLRLHRIITGRESLRADEHDA